jgi:hypothetical protein
MALSIFVAGPCKIQVALGGAYSDLGYTDNDNLPQITYTDNIHEVKTVASGAVAEELIVQNSKAVISATLVKWDASVWSSLLQRQRGAAYAATVGRMLVNDSGTFGVKILPTQQAKTYYAFARCYLLGDAVAHSQFGNVEQRLGLTFQAIPDQSNVLATTGST